ncbi:hypothetical protein [Sorangium sp. So ce1389]|uniref:hypothetical protein n=1 Tax=Sorangium sp. So ce1389 TaxID=3133336 RepID=UPI003F6330AF
MRVRLFEEVRRFRCAAVLAAALHATACHQVPDCQHCDDPGPDLVPVDGCGVFARASKDAGGSGRSDDPYTRLQDAIDHAEGRKVCACAGQAFAEAVTLRAGIEVHGGYTCNGEWKQSADKKSTIEGPAGQVALTLTGEAGGAKVQGFEIRAANATESGGASIAVAVANIAAELTQIDVQAGNGMAGENAVAEMGKAAAGADAPAGDAEGAPTDAWIATAPMGGKPGRTTCDGVVTDGGAGGPGGLPPALGTESSGRPGEAGKPHPDAMVNGNGGTVDFAGYGQSGSNGAHRGYGSAGDGGRGGRLTLAGITGGDGARGKPGNPGQGGGGGAGSSMLQARVAGAGASGGGGGAGGCGGRGGAGGKAGGSSIGIISLGTLLVLSEVSVTLGEGGKGGDGAAGQEGGPGGRGAPGGVNASDPGRRYAGTGGNGSDGGSGGPGGGGRGGHAIGIAYDAAGVSMPSLTTFSPGSPGDGGLGGPGVSSEAGIRGEGAACWNFRTGTSCAP